MTALGGSDIKLHKAPLPPPPVLSQLLQEFFPVEGVDTDSIEELQGYDDLNCYVRARVARSGWGELVFKVINRQDSLDPKLWDGITSEMRYLHSQGFRCPYPISSRAGTDVVELRRSWLLSGVPDRRQRSSQRRDPLHLGVLLEYIPGTPLSAIEMTPQLMYATGAYVGRMDQALQGFSHPAIDEREFLNWDLKHFFHVRKYLGEVASPERRKLAEDVLKTFNNYVKPKLGHFKQGTIHGDANELNILYRVEPGEGSRAISGVIDIGDTISTCYIFELAILLAHTMKYRLHKQQLQAESLSCIESVGPLISGYLNQFPLTEDELDCLYYSVAARLCQMGLVCTNALRTDPDTYSSYLMKDTEENWKALERLWAIPKIEVDAIWLKARETEHN